MVVCFIKFKIFCEPVDSEWIIIRQSDIVTPSSLF